MNLHIDPPTEEILRDVENETEEAEERDQLPAALDLHEDGTPKRTLANVITTVGHHPAWAGVLGYDPIGCRIVTLRPPPVRQGDRTNEPKPGPWRSDDTTRAIAWFSEAIGFEPTPAQINQAASVVARKDYDGATATNETIAGVLDQWRSEGSLVHEPTGIPKLDELTGGGPVYGTRWYLAGAPDAGKTALLIQLGHHWAEQGVTVGFLAVDEEPTDLVTRFAQRKGWHRRDTEGRNAGDLDRMQEALGGLSIRFYDSSWTIESAAQDLAEAANGGKAALLIDSIQTVMCDAEHTAEREMSEVAAVTARVRAVKRCATYYRLIAVATSEMGRSAYNSDAARRNVSTMAAGKWSGAIEYSARVLLGVRSVSDEKALVDLEIAKNKHGPRDEHVYLKIDRGSQTLWQTQFEPQPEEDAANRRDAKARARAATDARAVALIIRENPGLGARKLWAECGAKHGISKERCTMALSVLGDAVVIEAGPRNSTLMTVDETALPDDFFDD